MASVEVKVGVIGPSALGREAQNEFHRVIGSSALDWDRQMPDEPVVNFDAEVRRRVDLDGPENSNWDLLVRARGSLGNLRSGLCLGAQLRFGVLDQGSKALGQGVVISQLGSGQQVNKLAVRVVHEVQL
jgi:hypothetical protein